MNVNNPYLDKKRELARQIEQVKREGKDASELEKQYEETDIECRKFTQAFLDRAHAELDSAREKSIEIKTNKEEYPSLNKQLLAIRKLHKSAKEFADTIKDYKYQLYEEAEQNKKVK